MPCAKGEGRHAQAAEPVLALVSERDVSSRPWKGLERAETAPTEGGTAVTQKAEDPGREPRQTVDPLALALSVPVFTPPTAAVESGLRPALDPMVTEIVQSLAWGGDRRRGAARIELGGKRFAGASLVVHAEGDAVTIELGGTASPDVRELGERLRERLEKRGLTVRLSS